MASVTVQPLPASRRQQPIHREQRRKKMEEYLSSKMSTRKPSVPVKQNVIRSPLMERSNTGLLKQSGQINPTERKPVKSFDKENIRAGANKDGKNVTLSQSFIKTKTLTEKQMKDDKIKLESVKEKPNQSAKLVLGAYRGIIVQSKIHSFRSISNSAEGKSQNVESRRTVHKSVENQPKASTVTQKPLMKPPSSRDVKQKRPLVPPVSQQTRASTSQVNKSKSELVTVRRPLQVSTQKKPVGVNLQHKPQPVKTVPKNAPARSDPEKQSKNTTTGPVNTMPRHLRTMPAQRPSTSRFSMATETAEERKARLAEWRASKGKVMKRPPLAVLVPPACRLQKAEPEIKTEPEEPKEETRQLYWATMAEEDEQEMFTLRVHQIFGECQKLIDEGCPKEEVLLILEKQIQNVPEARKLSRYWECLARLEQRDGHLYKVIAICEEAVASGAQPLEELRTILADALEKLKADTEEKIKKESEKEDPPVEESKVEIKCESLENAQAEKKRRGRRRAVRLDVKSPPATERASQSPHTPENGGAASSVIRFNIRSTPHLEKMKKLQMNEGDSSIKSYKFLTPVRRSCRLEHKSHTLPDMLKDHDPCVAGISQLEELEDPAEGYPNAYIFRKNNALKEITAKSATKKQKPRTHKID
ncbi:cytoskeleton-associated protein 2 [Pseudophryne corroboree]|uniref:cytoskeleton-associated protein 2 n=1 Tax=Pseudophryne corroboree TaxID=495146 RepID=UPI0030820488